MASMSAPAVRSTRAGRSVAVGSAGREPGGRPVSCAGFRFRTHGGSRMTRQGRDVRRKGVAVTLSGRDEALLRALARFRVARSSDLVAYGFPGIRRDTALRRMRRLFDAGFLEVLATDRTEDNRYALGPEGKRWVRGQHGLVRPVPRGSLTHHLAIVRTWIDLALAVHALDGVSLVGVRPDWELREGSGSTPWPVVPDLLARLRFQVGEKESRNLLLAIEVDCGTEPLGVLRRKFAAYQEERRFGSLGPVPICLAMSFARPGTGWSVQVLQVLREEWAGATLDWTEDKGPQDAIKALVQAFAPPLMGSPCGKGRGASVSNCLVMDARGEGGGL
jgi:protein involved in plasmid replication-relaxation